MSEEIMPTPLGPDEVEVRTAYKPEEGWIVTARLRPKDGGSK